MAHFAHVTRTPGGACWLNMDLVVKITQAEGGGSVLHFGHTWDPDPQTMTIEVAEDPDQVIRAIGFVPPAVMLGGGRRPPRP